MEFHIKSNKVDIQVFSFVSKEAEEYGVDKAIFLQVLRTLLSQSKAAGTRVIEGRYWVYGSIGDFAELMPFYNETKIKRVTKRLEEDGLIITGFHSRDKFNRAKWYTMPEFKASQDEV